MGVEDDPLAIYLKDSRRQFRALKKQADRALAQVTDDDWFVTLDAESNSLARETEATSGR